MPKQIKSKLMENTILFGNGINMLSKQNISWDSLLDILKDSRNFDNDLLPNTMTYERIILERPDIHKDVKYDEFEVKKKIVSIR